MEGGGGGRGGARARDEVMLPEHGDDVWLPYNLLDRLLAVCHAALGSDGALFGVPPGGNSDDGDGDDNDGEAGGREGGDATSTAAAAALAAAVDASGGKSPLSRKVVALEDAMRAHFEKLILRESFVAHTRRVAANEVY